jgi:hypothetical protein
MDKQGVMSHLSVIPHSRTERWLEREKFQVRFGLSPLSPREGSSTLAFIFFPPSKFARNGYSFYG